MIRRINYKSSLRSRVGMHKRGILARIKRRGTFNRESFSRKETPAINIGFVRRLVAWVFLGGSGIWFLYFFLFSAHFQISQINITGTENIPKDELLGIINEYANQKSWVIVPNRNILFFSADELRKKIGDHYLVEQIAIDKNFPFRLSLAISEKLARVLLRTRQEVVIEPEPAAVPAGQLNKGEVLAATTTADVVNAETAEGESEAAPKPEPVYVTHEYFMDVNGIIVSEAPEKLSNDELKSLPVIEMELGSQTLVKPGDIMLERKQIEYISSVYEAVAGSQAGVTVTRVIYNPQIKNELIFVSSEGWQGFLTTGISLDTQIKKLELALQEKIKDGRRYLKYVDLRVKDRVYYK